MAVPTGSSLTTVSNLFIQDFSDKKINAHVREKSDLHKKFQANAQTVDAGGGYVKFHERNWGDEPEGFAEWDDLQSPSNVDTTRATFQMVAGNFTVRASLQALKYGGSIIDPLMYDIKRKTQAMMVKFEKMAFINATGKLADIVSVTSPTVIVIDDLRFVYEGMVIGVLVTASGVAGNGIQRSKITAVVPNPDTYQATVTLETALVNSTGVDTTYGIFHAGRINNMPWGLPDIVSASNPSVANFGAVDRTAAGNRFWQAREWDAENRAASGLEFAQFIGEIAGATDGPSKLPTDIYVNRYVLDDLIATAKTDSRIDMSAENFKLHGTSVVIATPQGVVPVRWHEYCYPSEAWFLNHHTLYMDHPSDYATPNGEWMGSSPTGKDKFDRVPGKAGWQAAWVYAWQRTCSHPRANGYMKNIKWARKGAA